MYAHKWGAALPRPHAAGLFILPANVTPSWPQFSRAQRACTWLAAPGGPTGQLLSGNQLSKAVKFVACMRSHGLHNFPHPTLRATYRVTLSATRACHPVLLGSGFIRAG
jgi:hypothetical protein